MTPDDKLLKSIAESLERIDGNVSASCQSLDEINKTLKELVHEVQQMRQFERCQP